MLTRTLGRSGIKVSAMGLGCWAIGGPFWHLEQKPESIVGYGDVDDDESIRAIQRAIDLGVNFFDTSDAYGCGRSERILGRALAGRREQVVIATKFGYVPDEEKRLVLREDASPIYIRQACEASLRRLNTDYIDLYQFHIHDYDLEKVVEVRDALEELVVEGKIRWYGWSTIFPEAARIFAEGKHCTAFQFGMNVFREDPGMLELCEQEGMAAILRGPLGMGTLTGKFTSTTTFSANDMRHDWNFSEGILAERLQQLEAVKEILTRNGRTLAQGALGWLWARSERTIPIPGFKTVAQAEENAGALEFGPLSDEQMRQVDEILGR